MAHEGYLESISKRQPCVIEFSSCCMLPQNRKQKSELLSSVKPYLFSRVKFMW